MTNSKTLQKEILEVRNRGLKPAQIINVMVKCMGYKQADAKRIVEEALNIDPKTLEALKI